MTVCSVSEFLETSTILTGSPIRKKQRRSSEHPIDVVHQSSSHAQIRSVLRFLGKAKTAQPEAAGPTPWPSTEQAKAPIQAINKVGLFQYLENLG